MFDYNNLVGFDWDEEKSEPKPIPEFNTEDEEREFWATHDSTEYIDWRKAEKNPTFSCLKPS